MTNDEIDVRLRRLAEMLPKQHAKRVEQGNMSDVAMELELLNMQHMAVVAMLGEIAKRLPEVGK